MNEPLLIVTLGDVCGVGPEIALRAHIAGEIEGPYVLVGDRAVLERCAVVLGLSVDIRAAGEIRGLPPGPLYVLDQGLLDADTVSPGSLSEAAGRAAYAYLQTGITLVREGVGDALVTLPINKEAVGLSVPGFTGHTDVIAKACGATIYSQSLVTDHLVVTHLSSHVSLREAIEQVRADRVQALIELTHNAVLQLGFCPKVAVMGLNPHAGEGGAFGREEIEHIGPAVEAARRHGVDAVGPLPPDTVFMRALRGEFGGVACMYHDQGHIALKTVGMDAAVNVALGMPIVRTSPDHGTAFDIAWQGKASTASYARACRLARRLVRPAMRGPCGSGPG